MNRHGQLRYPGAAMLRQVLAASAWLAITVGSVCAQRAPGTITGRVVTEDGQPVAHALVTVVGTGTGARRVVMGRTAVITDEEGRFQADGLDPMPYSIFARAPGYVTLPAQGTRDPWGGNQTQYRFLGESVTITLTRGVVITGRVTNAAGEPVIGVAVRGVRVRDAEGQRFAAPGGTFTRQTDDRGVYRLYGLLPGAYVVSAGGSGQGFSPRQTPYDGRMPIYHPSATRDTATEVMVRSGEEASGVDIRYRGERGFAVSGKVINAPVGLPTTGGIISVTGIALRQTATGAIIASTAIQSNNETASYAFYGVPNGEYEVVANWSARDEDGLAAAPRRITVNGRDVSGIDLTLAPTATVNGKVILEKLLADAAGQKCAAGPVRYVDEVIVHVRVDDANAKEDAPGAFAAGGRGIGVPSEKGDFTIRNLKAGRHRFAAQLPDENWYVKASKQTLAAGTYDVARHGLTLKAGERAAGVQLTVAYGAARVQGKVTAAEGASLPRRLRVHILPAEVEAKDDLLRFAETRAESDGAFSFGHLAPGKYLLIARPIPDSETSDRPAPPLAWDLAERAKLRKEAEAAQVVVELKSCQRVADYALRYGK